MKDLFSNVIGIQTIAPVVGDNADAPGAGTIIDRGNAGAESLLIFICTGVTGGTLTGSNYWTFAITHADDDGTGSAGAYTDVVQADVQAAATVASGIVVTINDNAEDDTIYPVGYLGGKRFVKVTSAEVGTAPTLPQAVISIKGDLLDAPVIA